jgi:hypothetical protein
MKTNGSNFTVNVECRCGIKIVKRKKQGHAVAEWLRRYATNRKVAGSRPDEAKF